VCAPPELLTDVSGDEPLGGPEGASPSESGVGSVATDGTDGDDGSEPGWLDESEAASALAVESGSAWATPVAFATAAPIPKATASAPSRPMYRALLMSIPLFPQLREPVAQDVVGRAAAVGASWDAPAHPVFPRSSQIVLASSPRLRAPTLPAARYRCPSTVRTDRWSRSAIS